MLKKIRLKIYFSLLIILLISNLFGEKDKKDIISNSLEMQKECEGRIELNEVRIWGDERIDREEFYFHFPIDIKIDHTNRVIISSLGEKPIKIFDRNGNILKSIGKRGQGPGDILNPISICINKNNDIIVLDYGSSRLQIFTEKGQLLNCIKLKYLFDQVCVKEDGLFILSGRNLSNTTGGLLFFYDSKGKLIKSAGQHIDKNKSLEETNSSYFDYKKDLFIAYRSLPFYQKYSVANELLQVVTFEQPFKTPSITFDSDKSFVFTKDGYKKRWIGKIPVMYEQVVAGMSIDDQDRIYLVTTARAMQEEDIFYFTGNKSFAKNKSETTDRYRLMVFDKNGRIIAVTPLKVRCDKIYVYDNKLFIVDTYISQKIYEYSIKYIN